MNKMNEWTRRGTTILVASGLLVGGTLAGAQVTGDVAQGEVQRGLRDGLQGYRGFGLGLRGLPFGRSALGTTAQITLYDGNPDTGGSELETLTFTYGEDSEAALAEAFAEAREDATFMTVEVSEQTRTVDLSEIDIPVDGRGLLPRELARGLEEGDTVLATFFDGDPEEAGQTLETLSFTYGQDSAAGFAEAFAEAAEEAAFVTVMTPRRATPSTLRRCRCATTDGGVSAQVTAATGSSSRSRVVSTASTRVPACLPK